MDDATQLFSTRVEEYRRYRPGYPRAMLDLLQRECGLDPDSVVADIGSGTGLLTRLLLEHGLLVYGVEPNDEMRKAAEQLLNGYARFRSVKGRSEATTLADRSINIVTSGQAFHWFEPQATRREFQRILKPKGWVALAWNQGREPANPFQQASAKFWEWLDPKMNEEQPDLFTPFFGEGNFKKVILPNDENRQQMDFEALLGSVLSSSRAPRAGERRYPEMVERLQTIFQAHQEQGMVTVEFQTEVIIGSLGQ